VCAASLQTFSFFFRLACISVLFFFVIVCSRVFISLFFELNATLDFSCFFVCLCFPFLSVFFTSFSSRSISSVLFFLRFSVCVYIYTVPT
jgi:hypothetical protein